MRKRDGGFVTKSEAAYEALLQAIRAGRLKAGQVVTLVELAQELDMSMTPIRDALTLLAEQGLVLRKPHHATVIAEQMISRSSEISMVRAIVEPEAARLAAFRADEKDLAAIAAVCDAADDAAQADDMREFRNLNQQFHLRVADASGSTLLAEFIGSLWKKLPVQGLTLSGKTDKILRDHRKLLQILQSGDGNRAYEMMSRHVGEAAELTKRYLNAIRLD